MEDMVCGDVAGELHNLAAIRDELEIIGLTSGRRLRNEGEPFGLAVWEAVPEGTPVAGLVWTAIAAGVRRAYAER